MERPRFEKLPLGPEPKTIRISQEEMHLAYLHRKQTGEPIQSWIRRLIRENWEEVSKSCQKTALHPAWQIPKADYPDSEPL